MEDSWASEIAFDELLKNPQHSLTITRTCAINNLWGYELIHRYKEPESRMGYTFAKNMKITPASVRAKKLNGKYLLEERFEIMIHYSPFGIEELSSNEKVDERLIERIKTHATNYQNQNGGLRDIEIKFEF